MKLTLPYKKGLHTLIIKFKLSQSHQTVYTTKKEVYTKKEITTTKQAFDFADIHINDFDNNVYVTSYKFLHGTDHNIDNC